MINYHWLGGPADDDFAPGAKEKKPGAKEKKVDRSADDNQNLPDQIHNRPGLYEAIHWLTRGGFGRGKWSELQNIHDREYIALDILFWGLKREERERVVFRLMTDQLKSLDNDTRVKLFDKHPFNFTFRGYLEDLLKFRAGAGDVLNNLKQISVRQLIELSDDEIKLITNPSDLDLRLMNAAVIEVTKNLD